MVVLMVVWMYVVVKTSKTRTTGPYKEKNWPDGVLSIVKYYNMIACFTLLIYVSLSLALMLYVDRRCTMACTMANCHSFKFSTSNFEYSVY